MENKPLITFIIPAYNAQKYVEQCLESLLNQTVMDHKAIVVDDGSIDGTGEICRKYAGLYPEFIQYLYQEHKGPGAARNSALNYTLLNSEYVMFLDSDDWLNFHYIEQFRKEMKSFSGQTVDIIFTLPVVYDTLTNCYHQWNDQSLFYEIFFSEKRLVNASQDPRLYDLEASTCRCIFRTEFLNRTNFSFPENVFWEDVFPHFYLLHEANRCLGIDKIGFYYRINTNNQTTSSKDSKRLEIVEVFAFCFDYAIRQEWERPVILSIIRMMIDFTKWSLEVTTHSVKIPFIKSLHKLYSIIPNNYFKEYIKKYGSISTKLLIRLLKTRLLYLLLNDYLFIDFGKNILKGKKD